MHRNVLLVIFLGLSLFVSERTSGADAQMNQNPRLGQGRDWSFRLGPMGLYAPEYEGSNDYGFLVYPLVYVTGHNTVFVDPRTGAGAYLWNRNGVKFDVFTAYSRGREENSSSDLAGLGDIEDGATGSVVFEYGTMDYFFHTRYEQRYAGEETGPQIHFGIGRNLALGRKSLLQPFVKATYSSSNYMQTHFGITPNQSELRAYEAESGFNSIGFEINAFYGLYRHWTVQALIQYNRLLGDAADSPLVEDKNQYRLGAALLYTF